MEMQTNLESKAYEQKLVRVVRRLPLERVSQVIDFAQFLEFQTTGTSADGLLGEAENKEEITVENAQWDALLATDKSQRLLEKMADAALADIQAGRARPMVFTVDGEIAPG
jgi:hypothetical protein